jgi:hypothetical protein
MKHLRPAEKPGTFDRPSHVASRRSFLLGGTALLASALLPVRAQAPGVVMISTGDKPTQKPVVLPGPDSKDPVAHSIAEQQFWGRQMMEHALFLTMFLPGDELAQQRAEAARFQSLFEQRLAGLDATPLTKDSYAAGNKSMQKEAEDFIAFKRGLAEAQDAGRIHTLAWPTFLDHISREEDHFVRRVQKLSNGDTSLDRDETAKFWSLIMGEHADFIAHLLDPAERMLIGTSQKAAEEFYEVHKAMPLDERKLEKAIDAIIDFKAVAEKGIDAGMIKSIIHPILANHVRREAIKASDEFRRSA